MRTKWEEKKHYYWRGQHYNKKHGDETRSTETSVSIVSTNTSHKLLNDLHSRVLVAISQTFYLEIKLDSCLCNNSNWPESLVCAHMQAGNALSYTNKSAVITRPNAVRASSRAANFLIWFSAATFCFVCRRVQYAPTWTCAVSHHIYAAWLTLVASRLQKGWLRQGLVRG